MDVADSKRLTERGRQGKIMAAANRRGAGGRHRGVDRGHRRRRPPDPARAHGRRPLPTRCTRRPPRRCARPSNRRVNDVAGARRDRRSTWRMRWDLRSAGRRPSAGPAMEGGAPPVIVGGECIGGVGVAGGDWATDERIAAAAAGRGDRRELESSEREREKEEDGW